MTLSILGFILTEIAYFTIGLVILAVGIPYVAFLTEIERLKR